jgi:hypothetical protein
MKFKSKNAVAWMVASVTLISFIYSLYLTENSPIWAFYSLPTRAWELGVGALIVLMPQMKMKRIFGLIGFILLFISSVIFNESTAFPGVNALLPVLGTALLIATVHSWPPFLNDVANSRVSQWLGRISYPLYLWHWPLLVLPSTYLARPLEVYERLIAIAATLLFADLTHRFVEEPFRHSNSSALLIYKKSAVVTVASVFLGAAIMLTNTDKIDVSGVNGAVSLAQIKARPLIYDDGCHANYNQTESGKCEYGDLSSTKTMVLYGDSHAAQWFPTVVEIAERSGYKLISLTKSACSSVEVVRQDRGAFNMSRCSKWRDHSIKRIQEIKPDVLIMSSFQYFRMPPQFGDRVRWWNEGQEKLLAGVKNSSTHLIYVTDTPHPERDIPSCLATNSIEECNDITRSETLSINGFKVIDPNPWLCSDICTSVKDGVVAYRDQSHISVDIARALIPRFTQALRDQGVNL